MYNFKQALFCSCKNCWWLAKRMNTLQVAILFENTCWYFLTKIFALFGEHKNCNRTHLAILTTVTYNYKPICWRCILTSTRLQPSFPLMNGYQLPNPTHMNLLHPESSVTLGYRNWPKVRFGIFRNRNLLSWFMLSCAWLRNGPVGELKPVQSRYKHCNMFFPFI